MERREPRKFLNSRYWSCRVLFNVMVIAGLCTIVVKAFRLQVIEHSFWVARANACLNTKFTVPAYRGTIYDRQGKVLSYSVPQRSLYAFAGQIENPAKTAALLSPILGEPAGTIAKKLTSSSHFVWIKRQLTDQQAIEIEKLKAPGLNLADEYKRFYPYRQVGGQIVGFVNIDGAGIEGIEKYFDDVLKGKPVPVCQLRDGGRKRLWLNSSAPPEPAESCGVKLSLDAFIEYIAEFELEKAAQKYRARAAEVVVMDTETFEVLAMASWPFFDPNIIPEKKDPKEELGRNHVISDAFEPGSAFKVFLMSAALDQNIVRETDRNILRMWQSLTGGPSHKGRPSLRLAHHAGGYQTFEQHRGCQNCAPYGVRKILPLHSRLRLRIAHRDCASGRIQRNRETSEEVETNRPGRNGLWAEHRGNQPSAYQRHCGDSQRRAIRLAGNRRQCP